MLIIYRLLAQTNLFIFIMRLYGMTFQELLLLACLVLGMSTNCTFGAISQCTTYNLASPLNTICPCTACQTRNYLNIDHCMACSLFDANCLNCNISVGCMSCTGSYHITLAGLCESCGTLTANCQDCNSTKCTTCNNNAYMTPLNNCILCSNIDSNCISCSNGTYATCTNCLSAFYLNSSQQCVNCITMTPFCNICNITTCMNCSHGYFLNSTSDCVLCSSNLSYCSDCANLSVCLSCINISYTSVSGLCQRCDTLMLGCQNCWCYSASSCCYNCMNDSYYLYNSSCYLCNSSLAGCLTCQNNSYCSSCNISYALISNNTCLNCFSSISFCLMCFNQTLCTKCVNDSYYLSLICYPCNSSLSNCQLCSDNQTCTQCIDSYFLMSSSCYSCFQFSSFCITCSPIQCLSCVNNFYFLFQNSCYLCSTYLVGCWSCTSNTTFTYCLNSSFILIDSNCYLCNTSLMCQTCPNGTTCLKCGLGFFVRGGCTRVKGCLLADPLMYLNLSSNCLSCSSTQFYGIPVNNSCVCKEGWPIGDHCGNIIGCNNLIIQNNVSVCTSCSSNHGFIFANGGCVCKPYYFQFASSCSQICGDGYIFVLPCDDGNLIDGDGCSSTCQIQINYTCKSTDSFPATKCVFKGRVTLAISEISRVPNSNSATIAFEILPYKSGIAEMNLSVLTNFTAAFCLSDSFQIVNQQLIVTFSFNQTVTNELANIFLQFDRNYIISPNFTLMFNLALSNGGQLIYFPHIGDINQNLIKIVQVSSFVSLGAFAAGSLAYKMIGVQTIHTFQIIMLLIVNSKAYPYLFFVLSNYTIIYGQFQQIFNSKSSHFINQQKFAYLEYTKSPLQNYLILTVLETASLVAYCILSLYFIYTKKRLSQSYKTLQRKTSKQRNQKADPEINNFKINNSEILINRLRLVQKIIGCVYDWLLFPLFIGFMFHFFVTLFVHEIFSSADTSSLVFKTTISLIIFIAIGKYLVCTNQIKVIFIQKSTIKGKLLKDECLRSYIPLYIFSEVLLFIVIATGLLNLNTFKLEISASIIMINLVYICLQRPYKHSIHNIAILLNQFTLTFIIGWLLLEKYSTIPFNIEKLLMYCLLGLMGAVLLSSLARIILSIWQHCFNQNITEQQLVQSKEKSKVNKHKKMKDQRDNEKKVYETILRDKEFMSKTRQKIKSQMRNPVSILTEIDRKNKRLIEEKKKKKNSGQMILKHSRADYHLKLIDK